MYRYRVKEIKRVVDGDTVDLVIDLGFSVYITHRVRLKNINAPETRTLDLSEKAKGVTSKEWLTKELSNDREWTISTFKEDKYGRYLGILTEEGQTESVNDRMVKGGLASPFMVDPHGDN